MTQIVIMPGGFHPFHAGHAALYNSARKAFPGAEVYVAATNDTSSRPFPFAVKEKLAKLAGVEPGHFVQVKSPFQAQEVTSKYDPAQDTLIFVRSEKDATKQPQAGGVKKDGSPSYLQPLAGQKQLEPFSKHAYMAYLPTVEFGPGMTSATEIRSAWPSLNDKRKTALVMSLYPATQKNPKLAGTVVKMLDTAIGVDVTEGFGARTSAGEKIVNWQNTELGGNQFASQGYILKFTPDALLVYKDSELVYKKLGDYSNPTNLDLGKAKGIASRLLQKSKQAMDENQGWAATLETKKSKTVPKELDKDPQLRQAMLYAKQHYPQHANDPEMAMLKWMQRSLQHSQDEDNTQDAVLKRLTTKVQELERKLTALRPNPDYIEEKWSQKYKRSIDCSNPKGFSQKAHCAGRKK